jgi:tetratricopeptide (TPR) repeat protein
MKIQYVTRRSWTIAIASTLLIVGIFAWRFQTHSTPTPTDSQTLAAIPPASGTSLTDQAINKWMQAARQNSKVGVVWVNLGNALMQKARETTDAGYYARAETVFRKALTLNSRDTSAMTGLAWVYCSWHQFDSCTEWANKTLETDPNNQDAYGLLGDAAVEKGDYQLAFKHYQKMLDLRPDLSSYSRGAHLLFLTGDLRKALWLMQKAIAAGAPYAENTAWCRAQLAQMLWSSGMLVPAQQVLQTAHQQTPNNHHVLAAFGRVQASLGNYPAAIDYYSKAAAVTPQSEIVAALGDLYELTGQKSEAERQYQLMEAIYQMNKARGVRNDIQMARFYADHDRNLPQALAEAEAVHRDLKNGFVADTLAWCYYKNGRYEDARNTIQKALELKTPDAGILFHAGMIHQKLGDRRRAQKYFHQALSLNPYFHPVFAKMAAENLKQLGAQPPNALLPSQQPTG